jgi:Cytochrome B6-F complex subunit VI (PetL)
MGIVSYFLILGGTFGAAIGLFFVLRGVKLI